MTRFRVAFSPVAARQVDAIDSWWSENRSAAPEMFAKELSAIVSLIEVAPLIGKPYPNEEAPRVRRILIGRSRYHVYWEVDDANREVTITSVWHAERGAGPPHVSG